jgi:tetratricopeptide (TPR) repeat protein
MYGQSGNFEQAKFYARENVQLAEAAYKKHPDDPRLLHAVIVAHWTTADLLTDESKFEEAVPIRSQILDLERRYNDLNHSAPESLRSLALAHKKLGALYGVLKRYDECRREYEEALKIDEDRYAHAPSPQAGLDLSYDYNDLGWVSIRQKSLDEALAFYRRGLDLREEAARADPADRRAMGALASSTERIGGLLHLMGDDRSAVETMQRAIVMWEKIANRSDSGWSAPRELSDTHAELASILVGMKQYSRAASEYDQARAIFASLNEKGKLPKTLAPNIAVLAAKVQECRKGPCAPAEY